MDRQKISLIILLLSFYSFTACKKCDPPQLQKTPALTEAEQQLIPNNAGDTLYFSDKTGSRFYLVCRHKELLNDGFSTFQKDNKCEQIRYSWNKLVASFSGNVVGRNGTIITFNTTLTGGLNATESGLFSPTTSCIRPSGSRYFILEVNQQQFFGFTDDLTLPVIQNFSFRPVVKLEGKVFDNVNTNQFYANSPSGCPAPAYSGSGADSIYVDSIYYSRQFGLLRFTTAWGQKYQRQL